MLNTDVDSNKTDDIRTPGDRNRKLKDSHQASNLPLGKNVTTDPLVYNNTKCVLCNIEHSASTPMVRLVRHTLLNSTITLQTE